MPIDSDYYAVLSVQPNVSPQDLKRQYRRLAKIYHPDRNPGEEEWCTEQLSKVNEAFAVLSDPRLRAQYDRQREGVRPGVPNGVKSTAQPARPKPSTIVDAPPDPRAYEAYHAAVRSSAKRSSRPSMAKRLIGGIAVCAALTYGISYFVVVQSRPDKPALTVVHSPHAKPVRVAGPVEIVYHRPHIEREVVHHSERQAVHHTTHHRHRPELTSSQKDARALAIAERVEAAKRAKNGL